jgi:hypothetical protein
VPDSYSAYPSPVSFSFPLDDLRKSLPGAEALAGLSGDALKEAVTGLLGALAEDAEVTVDGEMVTVTPRPVGPSTMAEADRLQEKAASRAGQGEFAKAEGIYRRVLELNPLAMKARRELAMVLVEMGKPGDAVDLAARSNIIEVKRKVPKIPQDRMCHWPKSRRSATGRSIHCTTETT